MTLGALRRLAVSAAPTLRYRLALAACIGLAACPPAQAGVEFVPSDIVPELKISYSIDSAPEGQTDGGLAGSAAGQAAQEDLWDRIRQGFALAEINPSLTRTHETWFKTHASYLGGAVERSRYYLFHIVEEVEKRGMPMEIALLPMIESAFNPTALSPKKASGIWQFIPATARVFGLKQNAWYDGRRDVLAATDAALDYLELLHGRFGSWELALAAYNCGEGCVSRAISGLAGKGQPVRYADLSLPTETRHYVPKLLAVRNIVMAPEKYGLNLRSFANEPYFMRVNLSQPMAAKQAAKLADISVDELLTLNPAYQRRVIHRDTPGVLLLPADKVEIFHYNLNRKSAAQYTLNTYRGKKGESVQRIAERFGVTLQWLKEHNPLQMQRGKLANAQTLYVPSKAQPTQPQRARGKFQLITHTVGKGDTLSALARKYDVDLAELRRHNGGVDSLKPGAKLTIPSSNG